MAKRILATLSDTRLFVQEWLANPQHTGAIAPSSARLANAMARWLPTDAEQFVVELGPGTGAITTQLLRRGLREDRLVAIEQNPRMAACLHERFPRAHIITGDAWQLDVLLAKFLPADAQIGAVVSSLPLLNFPKAHAAALARKIHDVLGPAGTWVQFSYHLTREKLHGSERFARLDSDVIWLNLPPARVSAYRK
jgi:phosphatidylethanolamine/phosphatidyl-N-methylethanolamine N-methyltransferase